MISEIVNLRMSIETELTAMRQGLHCLAAGVAKHQFIEAKMKRISGFEDQLARHIGGEQALLFSCQAYIRIMESESKKRRTNHAPARTHRHTCHRSAP